MFLDGLWLGLGSENRYSSSFSNENTRIHKKYAILIITGLLNAQQKEYTPDGVRKEGRVGEYIG